MSLTEEVSNWLSSNFPGSSLADGYFFLVVKSTFKRDVVDGDFQLVGDELTKGKCWLLVVGGDPRPVVQHLRAEESSTVYYPDWNIYEDVPMWVLDVSGSRVDIGAVGRILDGPSLVALIDPDNGLVFHADQLAVHATNEASLNSLIEACPLSFRTLST